MSEEPDESRVVDTKPPSPRLEIRPLPPSDDQVWQAGYWKWSGSKYLWVAGKWVRKPSTRAAWISGYWQRQRDGWIWKPGSWKR
jgi:hypothetical protein